MDGACGAGARGLGIDFDSGVPTVPGPFEADPTARQPFGVDVTANGRLDGDTGPNNEQNFPVLTAGRLGQTGAADGTGRLEGERDGTYVVDVYANRTPHTAPRTPQEQAPDGRACDASERGEGEVYVASTEVTTDALGSGEFGLSVPGARTGDLLTATVTKTAGGDTLMQPPPSTSEFSPCFAVEAAPALAQPGPSPTSVSDTATGVGSASGVGSTSGSRTLAARGAPWAPAVVGVMLILVVAARRRIGASAAFG